MNQKFRMRYTGKRSYGKYVLLTVLLLVTAAIGTVYILGLLNFDKPKVPDVPQGQELDLQPQDNLSEENSPEEIAPSTLEEKTRPEGLLFEYVKMSNITGYAPPEGNNAVVLELKDANGTYAADVLGVDALKGAIAALKQKNIYIIGALYTFRDDTAAKENLVAAVHYDSEQIWLDGNMKRWLNPYLQPARDLVIQSLDKILELDADEIMLLECNFPSNGRTSLIDYLTTDTTAKEQVLADFLTEISKRVKTGEKRFLSVALPVGKYESSLPENIGTTFDHKACGADAVYEVDGSMTFTEK